MPVSMHSDERMEEEGSHAEPSQATATELERVADSGESGKHGENGARSASGDDEAEDDAASEHRRARNVVGQKGYDGPTVLQTAYDKHTSSSAKQGKSVKVSEEDAPKHPEPFISSRQQPVPESVQQHGGASQHRGWEKLNMATKMAKREEGRAGKTIWRKLLWKPRNQQHRRQTSMPRRACYSRTCADITTFWSTVSSKRSRCLQVGAFHAFTPSCVSTATFIIEAPRAGHFQKDAGTQACYACESTQNVSASAKAICVNASNRARLTRSTQ
ncbi:hypothetical protein HPB51_029065 [Rhipicephalus microplus]|uniref:Uncharacterized protein n=1 Tax=Rhipicephalus microplus TaxID=6941 RepID=A0A9J6CV79_RHIMP|nr:hypothetical protein HPB51_029065 [Rhipicephalus microplus]